MFSKLCILTILAVSLTTGALWAEETNPVLGKVGDFVLREADLDRILANQPPSVQKRYQDDPQQRIGIVREILIKKAIVARAKKDAFDRKPEIKEQLSYIYDNFIAQEYLLKVVTAGVSVPEEDLKRYYQEHENDFMLPEQIKVRHILFATVKESKPAEKEKARSKAESILQRLRKGEDFIKLAGENSEDPISAPKGGELAPITLGKTNSEEFEKAAFALKTGEISDIVLTSYGFHIIKMDERAEKQIVPFNEARDFIFNKLKAEQEQKRVQIFVEQVVKDADMEVSSEKSAATQESRDKKQTGNNTGEVKK